MAKFKTSEEEPQNTIKQTATDKFQSFVDAEVKSSSIEEGLSEIYQGEDGRIVDMKNVTIDHGHSWLYRIFIFLFNLCLIASLAWVGYYYFHQYKSANDTTSVELTINGAKEAIAGKEVTYTVDYKNLDRIDLKNVAIKVAYPEGFVFESAEPAASTSTNVWTIGDLMMRRSGEIKIKGRFVAESSAHLVALATMTYMPSNFSSEFKKDASFDSVISGIGLDVKFDAPENILVGDENQVYISFNPQTENYLNKFRVTLAKLDNLDFGTSTDPLQQGIYNVVLSSTTLATSTASSTNELRVKFTFKNKINDKENLSFNFEYTPDGQKYYSFLKKDLPVEVLTKNINLNMLINGSKDDQGIDFGAPLNYTISYANKGEQAIKNLVVMAVIDGDFVNWSTLHDDKKGIVRGNKISWSKDQMPELAELAPGAEGVIDFSVNIASSSVVNPAKNYQVKSYARFMLGSTTADVVDKNDNRSNEIVSKINSNLNMEEQVRYFNEDNIPVGSGPQPPKVGEVTSYRVYWNLTNGLNDLSDLKVETELPASMSWDNKSLASMGSLSFDATTHKIAWTIPKLPVNITKANVEFSVSFAPTTTDANRIAILLNQTTVTANDEITKAPINKIIKPKTSKLEDDPIAASDGMVVNK